MLAMVDGPVLERFAFDEKNQGEAGGLFVLLGWLDLKVDPARHAFETHNNRDA